MTQRCSDLARRSGEPLAGTAPYARAWVALEQPGPWGPRALTDSHLDRGLGAALAARSADLPVTVVLVRRPGHHADHHVGGPRALVVAHVGPGATWLERTTVDDPRALLDLDLERIAEGEPPGVGDLDDARLLLVCTNARRDTCCALRGRPAVADLSARFPGRVWESAHLGGHRFAPTVLSLPDGFVYGGPDAAGLGGPACRGRSALPAPAQAAELAVLEAAGIDPRPTSVDQAGDGQYAVGLAGRSWSVTVTAHPITERPESCGRPAVPGTTHRAVVHVPPTGRSAGPLGQPAGRGG